MHSLPEADKGYYEVGATWVVQVRCLPSWSAVRGWEQHAMLLTFSFYDNYLVYIYRLMCEQGVMSMPTLSRSTVSTVALWLKPLHQQQQWTRIAVLQCPPFWNQVFQNRGAQPLSCRSHWAKSKDVFLFQIRRCLTDGSFWSKFPGFVFRSHRAAVATAES